MKITDRAEFDAAVIDIGFIVIALFDDPISILDYISGFFEDF